MDPANVTALVRRAKARIMRRDFEVRRTKAGIMRRD
jgi:hypothetical protein